MAGAWLLVAAGPLTAQEGQRVREAEQASSVASVERAMAELAAAERRYDERWTAYDSMRTARYVQAGVVAPAFGSAGPLRVVATAERLSAAESAVREVWPRFGHYVSDPVRHLGDATLAVTWTGDPAVEGTTARGGRRTVRVSRRLAGHVDAADAVDQHLSMLLGQILGVGSMDPVDRSLAYRLVMTRESAAVGECVRGEAEACWNALGVGPLRPAWRNWIRDEEFPGLVASMPATWFRSAEAAARERCLADADETVCEGLLLRNAELLERARLVDPPFGSELTRDLTVHALERGGAGAFERLLDSRGVDLRARLTDAARTDPDELVLEWMEVVKTRGTSRADRSRRGRSAALLWYLLFAGFAARSSRWRLD